MTLVLMVTYISCDREEPYAGADIRLRTSLDTIRFDTVFTSIGSATRSIKIYNDEDRAISVSSISLTDGGQFFRMNVDGVATAEAKNVIIQPLDSIYVFTEVTVDPDLPLSVSPFIIEEDLIINTGEKQLKVHLEAWGQNANYFPSKSSKGKINLVSCNLQEVLWDDPKPYVIYGVLAIDSCTLVLPEGTHIYVHGGIAKNGTSLYNDGLLIFLKDGKIRAEGSVDSPVIVEGDRLESDFNEVAGQWAGIRIFAESTGNEIKHTIIKNSIVGVRVDSLASLLMEESMIFNTTSSGLIGYNASIDVSNSLFYNNGGNGIQCVYGGQYNINYCTISNYDNQSQGLIMTNYRCSDAQCLEDIFISPLTATVINCIVDGNGDEEFIIDDISDGMDAGIFNVSLAHNTIKSEIGNENEVLSTCQNCQYISFNDKLFLDRDKNNYQLDTNSIAEMKALPLMNITIDILGNQRDAQSPDAGCYEFQ
jgi:hypothetical protein